MGVSARERAAPGILPCAPPSISHESCRYRPLAITIHPPAGLGTGIWWNGSGGREGSRGVVARGREGSGVRARGREGSRVVARGREGSRGVATSPGVAREARNPQGLRGAWVGCEGWVGCKGPGRWGCEGVRGTLATPGALRAPSQPPSLATLATPGSHPLQPLAPPGRIPGGGVQPQPPRPLATPSP